MMKTKRNFFFTSASVDFSRKPTVHTGDVLLVVEFWVTHAIRHESRKFKMCLFV